MKFHIKPSHKHVFISEEGLLRPHSALAQWEAVSPSEMEGFLGIILNMGLVDMPEIQDYWSTNWITHVPFFSHVMPRRRFMNIFCLLHVSCERDGMPPRRIDKVKSFLDPLLHQFQTPARSQVMRQWLGILVDSEPCSISQTSPRSMGSRPLH